MGSCDVMDGGFTLMVWCALLCCSIFIGIGGVVMMSLGAVCIDAMNSATDIPDWCPERRGAIALTVVGTIVTFVCCCGGVKKANE